MLTALACALAFAAAPIPDSVASPRTLEDIFGDTGKSFQGAIGLINFEGQAGDPAQQSFGVAIDDMYVEWKELAQHRDETACSTGSCAELALSTTNLFSSSAALSITLIDRTPYGSACSGTGLPCYPGASPTSCPGSCVPAFNDCDQDGLYFGPGDDQDCDDDGVPDLVVIATSAADLAGERLVLDRHGDGPSYRGNLTTSLLVSGPGTLLLASVGAQGASVVLSYLDLDDGTGQPCRTGPDPATLGLVRTSTSLLFPTCNVRLSSTSISDNGDDDLSADSSETVEVHFGLTNECGFGLTGCVARLHSPSPEIECIQQATIAVGDLPADVPTAGPAPFRFRVSPAADRDLLGLGPTDELSASFIVSVACNEIDATSAPQSFELTLDLDLADLGQTPHAWVEGFEGGTLGKFAPQNLDAGIPGNNNVEGLANGDGWRCQYNSPDWVYGTAYNHEYGLDCFPAMNLNHANAVFWTTDGLGAPHVGPKRAKSGSHSMYYGVFLTNPAGQFTTPMAVVESVATTAPIHLGVHAPRLSFWHQVSFLDHRRLNMPPLRNADRGVIQIQFADAGGTPMSDWQRLEPDQNGYDDQAYDGYFNCTFDPVDDGNTEEDFFDPTDPERIYGPSSTCFPAFSYGWMGHTEGSCAVQGLGHASNVPGTYAGGSLGPGCWVETVVDLAGLRGRTARIRFLASAMKGTQENWAQQFPSLNPGAQDDGWWIDEIVIDETLDQAAELRNDRYALGSCAGTGEACIAQCSANLAPCSATSPCGVGQGTCVAPCAAGIACSASAPDCGPGCSEVVAHLSVTPPPGTIDPGTVTTVAPGQALELNAADSTLPSTADACEGGVLQSRYCASGDPDGGGPGLADDDCDDPLHDVVLRDWTDFPAIAIAPAETTTYVLEVRCATEPACLGRRKVDVVVQCPGGVNALGLADLRAVSADLIRWAGEPLDVDWLRGSFISSADVGDYVADLIGFTADATELPLSGTPAAGTGWYWLVKADGPLNTIASGYYCNSRTWRSGGARERPEPARDAAFGDP